MQLQNPAISQAIERHMATGNYRSADEVVLSALKALDDYSADLAESIADEEAGRMRPLADIAAEIRTKRGFGQPS